LKKRIKELGGSYGENNRSLYRNSVIFILNEHLVKLKSLKEYGKFTENLVRLI